QVPCRLTDGTLRFGADILARIPRPEGERMTETPPEDFVTLRERVASASGPSRTDALIALGRALLQNLNEADPAGDGRLDEAVAVAAEAFAALEPTEGRWNGVATALCLSYVARYLGGGFAEEDAAAAEAIGTRVIESSHGDEMVRDGVRLFLGYVLCAQAIPAERLRLARDGRTAHQTRALLAPRGPSGGTLPRQSIAEH